MFAPLVFRLVTRESFTDPEFQAFRELVTDMPGNLGQDFFVFPRHIRD
jgi:hypothetical protein